MKLGNLPRSHLHCSSLMVNGCSSLSLSFQDLREVFDNAQLKIWVWVVATSVACSRMRPLSHPLIIIAHPLVPTHYLPTTYLPTNTHPLLTHYSPTNHPLITTTHYSCELRSTHENENLKMKIRIICRADLSNHGPDQCQKRCMSIVLLVSVECNANLPF